jgi:hypothetical protein
MILSYLIGQKYFPVKYNLIKFFGYLSLAIFLYVLSRFFVITSLVPRIFFHTLLLLIFVFTAWHVERRGLSKVL